LINIRTLSLLSCNKVSCNNYKI